MKQILTQGIVLARTDYGEADRIITVLTPEQGKLRLMARGVRKNKSKLAGGIELFSISDLTYIRGRGEIGTLISSRLDKHYGAIVKDIARVQMGYEIIKQLNKATEDNPEPFYFEILQHSFAALDSPSIDLDLIKTWFEAQLIKQAGHQPNLNTDTNDQKLDAAQTYNFDFDNMSFTLHPQGRFRADHIKTLRLLFSDLDASALSKVKDIKKCLLLCQPLISTMLQTHLR